MVATSFEDPQLQALLEKIAQDEGFKQPKFEISMGSKPGDNYIGRIYRAVITEGDGSKSTSLIFKASPISKLRQQILSSDTVFRTERNAYQLVLPTLNSYMKKHGVVESSTFPGTARCRAVELADESKPDDVHVLVLEDKAREGYRMADRIKGLDADHVRLVLEKVAYWHAASIALFHNEPETANMLRNKLSERTLWNDNENHPLLIEIKNGLPKSLEMLEEPYKKGNPVYDRIEKLCQRFNVESVRLHKFPEDLPCIIHGDCWTNNFLFKYNKDGVVEDVCLIDLQITRVCSPAIELAYLFFVCTTKETRDAHFDDLIRFYYDKVSSILTGLGCDPEKAMPFELLLDHLRRYGLNGVFSALICLPVFSAESSDVVGVDINSADHDGNVFVGTAKITNPERLAEISKKMSDVVTDAARWGYF